MHGNAETASEFYRTGHQDPGTGTGQFQHVLI
jgi:hypothetical protein